jgi:ornithine carrier protein
MDKAASFAPFFHGFFAGSFGSFISHPFDTVRVRIQGQIKANASNNANFSLLKSCTNEVSKMSLPKDLYRGLTPALMGIAAEKALVFGTYQNCYKILNPHINNKRVKDLMSGATAGLVCSSVVAPVERIKIPLQTQSNVSLWTLLKENPFRGWTATLSRETPGFAIYFATYNAMRDRWMSSEGVQPWKAFLMGGLAGTITWAFIYPQDLIKTNIQKGEFNSMRSCISFVMKNYGLRGFYRGFGLALMRAVPLHAGTFFTYEMINSKVLK